MQGQLKGAVEHEYPVVNDNSWCPMAPMCVFTASFIIRCVLIRKNDSLEIVV